METSEMIADIGSQLAALGTTVRAEQEKRYMKSAMRHHGVAVPQLREFARQYRQQFELNDADQCVALAAPLWQSEWFEERSLAILFCAGEAEELTPLQVTNLFEDWLQDIRGWAHLDSLCIEVIGKIGRNHKELWPRVFSWRLNGHMWTRRASLISLMQVVRDGSVDRDQLRATCADLSGEKEFFIRKAIGWILREGVRKELSGIDDIIVALGPKLSPLSLREAIRRYPVDKQAEIKRLIVDQ